MAFICFLLLATSFIHRLLQSGSQGLLDCSVLGLELRKFFKTLCLLKKTPQLFLFTKSQNIIYFLSSLVLEILWVVWVFGSMEKNIARNSWKKSVFPNSLIYSTSAQYWLWQEISQKMNSFTLELSQEQEKNYRFSQIDYDR